MFLGFEGRAVTVISLQLVMLHTCTILKSESDRTRKMKNARSSDTSALETINWNRISNPATQEVSKPWHWLLCYKMFSDFINFDDKRIACEINEIVIKN